MRKCLTVSVVSLVLLLLLVQTTCIAFAEVKAAGADIPVVIDGGGTAYMIPDINSPLPKEVSIRVDNGRTGHFYIDFTEAGVFRYTIKAGFFRDGEERPADEVFRLTITVVEQDGTLHTVSVINGDHSSKKTDEVRFKDKTEPSSETETAETVTYPHNTTEPSTGGMSTTTVPHTQPNDSTTLPPTGPYDTTVPTTLPSTLPTTRPYNSTEPTTKPSETPRVFRIFSAPKTGDESHLAHYLLIAMVSSAGLFLLALLYASNTKKLIKKD